MLPISLFAYLVFSVFRLDKIVSNRDIHMPKGPREATNIAFAARSAASVSAEKTAGRERERERERRATRRDAGAPLCPAQVAGAVPVWTRLPPPEGPARRVVGPTRERESESE